MNNLSRLWLDQLGREFYNICSQHKIDLSPPIFELSEAKKQLGCWLPEVKTIRISHDLILSHSWDVVIMIIKHEMAHQICSELFFLPAEGHGKMFQKACLMLGLPYPYNLSSGDLPEVTAELSKDPQTEAGRKIITRISKLLALAGSTNEHEAALAMQRATELLHRHNLDMAALEELSPCVRLIIKPGKKQIPSYRRTICAILRDYFFVKVVYSYLYDPETDNTYKTIELLGRAENVPVAEHCYYFLEQQLPQLWQKNRHKHQGNTRTAKNSYYLGLLHGFSEKMAHQTRQNKENSRIRRNNIQNETPGELAIREDRELQDFVGFHFPSLVTLSRAKVRIYDDSYSKGVDTGRKMVLHRTVTEKNGSAQRLIE